MQKFSVSVLLVVLHCWPLTGHSSPARGIVSLDLCTDWMLLKYASRSQVVAYSPMLYRNPPDWVEAGLPTHDGSLEQLVSLAPQRVIAGEFNAIQLRKRLQQMGYQISVLPLPTSLAGIDRYQDEFLRILGGNGEQAPDMDFNPRPSLNRRLLLLGANSIATGHGTLEHGLITRAGWTNYIQHEGYQPLPIEQIVADPPDAIYWSAPDSPALANLVAQHPALGLINSEHLSSGDPDWRWQCPGPWTRQLFESLLR